MENDRYRQAAERGAAFIEKHLTDGTGRLYLRYREGEAAHKGLLDDYAFYAYGLLALYEATFDLRYLARAAELAEMILRWFGAESGGCYLSAKDGETLIQRPMETYDGAMPSGNSVAGYVCAKLAALTGEPRWLVERDKQLAFLAGAAAGMPSAHCFALFAMGEVCYPTLELVCVSAEKTPSAAFLAFLRENGQPGLSVLWKNKENAEKLADFAPFTADYPIPDEGEVYYLCRGQHCFAPQTALKELYHLMQAHA